MKFFKHGMVTENKAFEFLLSWDKSNDPFTLASFDISFSTKGDHAGLQIYKRLWKFTFEFNFYDTRHWNRKTNAFYLPGEEEAELEARGYCFRDECDDEKDGYEE